MLDIAKLQAVLGYEAKDTQWLIEALTHKSTARKDPEAVNNERLEFMGDAVVDMVVADMLFDQFPDDDEGKLSRKRASLVNEESLYNLAMRLQLDEFLVVNEAGTALRTNKRLLAGALEAVIGAIYKDSGFEKAYAWVKDLYEQNTDSKFSEHDFAKDFKTRFQELVQEKFKVTPIYKLIGIAGPDHQKQFKVQVMVEDQVYGVGEGESKKVAAQAAAEIALKRFNDV